MSDKHEALHAFEASGSSPPEAPARMENQQNNESAKEPVKHRYVHDGFQNRTKGEKAFNIGTYIGVGYFGSLAATVLLTWFLRDSKIGWPKYQKLNDFIAKSTSGNRTGESLANWKTTVDSNMTILSMFTGTTLMAVFPIKWIEDRKAKIVKKLDERIYGKEALANDPKLIAAHHEIDNSPKQTWSSIGLSRVVAFGATMATSLAIGSNKSPLARATGHSIDSISIRAGRGIDRLLNRNKIMRDIEVKGVKLGDMKVDDYIKRVEAHSPLEVARGDMPADRTTSRIFNYLTLDGLYTVMTSGLLFIGTRVFAPVFDKRIQNEKRDEKASQHAHPVHSRALPLPANDRAPAPANDTEAPKPHNQVHAVAANARIAQEQQGVEASV